MPYIPSHFKPFDVDFDDLGTLPEPKAEGRSPLDEEESLASWMQENMLKSIEECYALVLKGCQ
jgi:hypothetical protein